VHSDCCQAVETIADKTGILVDSCYSIIRKDLKMRNISQRILLMQEEYGDGMQISELFNTTDNDHGFLQFQK
jgi:hypothetical protein